tara:strand:- start:197 stop:514 length:318 start_codon:yes stop_codon:yes gene_type:complete
MASYIRFSKTAILDDAKRLNNSRNGNPRYSFKFHGLGVEGKSSADAGWVYSDNFENHGGKLCRVQYHFTNGGKAIIDNVEVIVGLDPKGSKAKSDTSGFVVREYA